MLLPEHTLGDVCRKQLDFASPQTPTWKCDFTFRPMHKRTQGQKTQPARDVIGVPRTQIQPLLRFQHAPTPSTPMLLLLSFVPGKFYFLHKKLRQRVQLPSAVRTVFCQTLRMPDQKTKGEEGTLRKIRPQLFKWNDLKPDLALEGGPSLRTGEQLYPMDYMEGIL